MIMALEWNVDKTDIENVKNTVTQKMESHGISQTMLGYRLDVLNNEAIEDLKASEEGITADNTNWSEHPSSSVDAQGYINDDTHEEMYRKSYSEYDALFEKHKFLIYEYADGMDTLEAMKVDFPDITKDVDTAIEEIEKLDEDFLKKEVVADYNADVKIREPKNESELDQYPEKYKEHYQNYHNGVIEKDKAIDIIDKYNMSYGEIQREYSFQQIDLHSKFKSDLNLVISGNDEALQRFNLEKDIDPVDAYTEVAYAHMIRFTPDDYVEKKEDLRTYDTATEHLERNPYGSGFLSDIDKHNTEVFLKNLEMNGEDKVLDNDYEQSPENIKGIKIEDMSFDYNNLKDERLQEFTMVKDADVLDVQFNDNQAMNIYKTPEEKAAINQYKSVDIQKMDLTVDEYMQYVMDRKNGVEQSKHIEQKVNAHIQSDKGFGQSQKKN